MKMLNAISASRVLQCPHVWSEASGSLRNVYCGCSGIHSVCSEIWFAVAIPLHHGHGSADCQQLSDRSRGSPKAGALVYTKYCFGCHRGGNTQAFAPSLSGYLRQTNTMNGNALGLVA